jgi:ABC-type sugar transport system ATPase subunit
MSPIIGPGGSGKDELALALARLASAASGRIRIGGRDLAELPEAVSGRRSRLYRARRHLFAARVRDNLLYGLRTGRSPAALRGRRAPHRRQRSSEARRRQSRSRHRRRLDRLRGRRRRTRRAGIDARIVELLRRSTSTRTSMPFGLRGTHRPRARPDLAERMLEARRALRERLAEPGITPPRRAVRSRSATTATPRSPRTCCSARRSGRRFDFDHLAQNTYRAAACSTSGLTHDLVAIGADVAAHHGRAVRRPAARPSISSSSTASSAPATCRTSRPS